MNKPILQTRFPKCFKLLGASAMLLLLTAGTPRALGDVVYVTALTSNCTATAICGDGVNLDINPNTYQNVYYETFGAYTSARVTAVPDKPATPGARYFSNSFSNSTPDVFGGITLQPALGVPGGVYRVFHIYSSTANNVSTNLIVGVNNNADCTLSFTETDKFQRKYGQPSPQKWQFLGYLTNDVDKANPVITFFFKEGLVNATLQNRLLVDTFRFSLNDPCMDIEPVGVTGPLEATTSTVTVTAVTNATAVTVYQNSGTGFVAIGTKTSGVVNGNNAVSVTGLVKGAVVAATQTVNGQEGCVPTAGVTVGGGPNPRLRVALSIREAVNATGPVGADGSPYTTNSGRIHYLGASAIRSGQGPMDGRVIYPSNDWQTITFNRGPDYLSPIDPTVIWNSNISGQGGTQNDLQGDWGTIEAIAFALDDTTDTGSFLLYIDNITNGGITNTPQVVEDFEAAPARQSDYTFRATTFSGTTSGNILNLPNDAVVDNTVADTGSKSIRARFQWANLGTNNWLRFTTFSAPGGHRNPMVNLNDPISFRLLFQPAGATLPPRPAAPSLSGQVLDGNFVLNWTGGHRLQAAPDPSGTYTNMPQTILWPNTNTYVGPYTNDMTAPAKFFRLVD